jgi:hypothetical protein
MLMLSIDRLPFRAQLSIMGGLVGMCRLLLVRSNRPTTPAAAAANPEQQQSVATQLLGRRVQQHRANQLLVTLFPQT